MKSGFLDKLIDRLDRLDPDSLQTQFLRLARDRRFFETLFHALREGVMVTDAKGRILFANRSAEALLGLAVGAAEGRPIGRYLDEFEWDRILSFKSNDTAHMTRGAWETASNRAMEAYVVPLAADPPSESGVAVILRDVTEAREEQAGAIESERLNALTLLAASVAHEIGNPLNALNIHLQLMARKIRERPEDAQGPLGDLLGVARAEVERLDRIVTQFLRAVRPSPPAFEPLDLNEALLDTLRFLETEIRDRDVLLETECAPGMPPALADRQQIRQAFFNIIRNAIQVMPNGGLLKITLEATDDHLLVSFKDTGPGISPEDLGSIFEPYHTTKPDGSGLGLLIVQRIMKDHGGQIEVHSDPNTGATFTLLFPRHEHRIRLLKEHRATQAGDRVS